MGGPDPHPPDEHRPVPRLDLGQLVAAVRAAGGPALEVVGPLPGGASGAGVVRHPDGREHVLTWAPAPPPGADQLFDVDRTLQLMEVARAVGNPVPRYDAVFALPDGRAAVLQERVDGVPVTETTARLVERALALASDRRDALRDGGRDEVPPTPAAPLFLTASGPGFCHHETLRRFDETTRQVLTRVEAIGAELGDTLSGSDLVHFDYTLGNVLVARDDPERIVAVVDWDGVGRGDVVLDLAVLAFDLTWRSPDLGLDVESRARSRASPEVFAQAWAHVSLRLVDWAIRHDPRMVPHWVAVSLRHL